jgi:hypothetical protein
LRDRHSAPPQVFKSACRVDGWEYLAEDWPACRRDDI